MKRLRLRGGCNARWMSRLVLFRRTKNLDTCVYVIRDAFVSAGTPYAGGVFRIKLALGKDFPQAPPKAFFLTRVFHPNVANNGEICVNTLKKDWRPDLGIKHILLVSGDGNY